MRAQIATINVEKNDIRTTVRVIKIRLGAKKSLWKRKYTGYNTGWSINRRTNFTVIINCLHLICVLLYLFVFEMSSIKYIKITRSVYFNQLPTSFKINIMHAPFHAHYLSRVAFWPPERSCFEDQSVMAQMTLFKFVTITYSKEKKISVPARACIHCQ